MTPELFRESNCDSTTFNVGHGPNYVADQKQDQNQLHVCSIDITIR